jgi:serine protease Do
VFKSWLGLVLSDVPDKDRQRYGLEYGLVVSTVERGSPADDVGIHATDIILEMNLTPLKSVADYEAARQTVTASGKPVLFRVLRGRQAFYAAISQ